MSKKFLKSFFGRFCAIIILTTAWHRQDWSNSFPIPYTAKGSIHGVQNTNTNEDGLQLNGDPASMS